MKRILATTLLLALSATLLSQPLRVGSKKFTEAVILGELLTQALQAEGIEALHEAQLGGTRVLWRALLEDEIQIYPEYTGTLIYEILQTDTAATIGELQNRLRILGIGISAPLGFNNTYALGMRSETAHELRIHTISDLRHHPDLRFGLTNEFMDRADGWPSLRDTYNLPQTFVRGLDHDLAYRGLASNSIQVMDLYTTDAEINYYQIFVLEDDLRHFPEYKAIVLYRLDALERQPALSRALGKLEGKLDEKTMIAMNSAVKLGGRTEGIVAAEFLHGKENAARSSRDRGLLGSLVDRGREHLIMVLISLTAAIVIALPLGILAARKAGLGRIVLASVGIIQTIPSLALLVFMIPLLGIGAPPAVLALFLYSLLPIVRNTVSGLQGIQTELLESARTLGMSDFARLRKIELPLAFPSILAGIKTAAVINVGTATLGALIGAGGYGQPILTGIRLDSVSLILQGAIPAALLALGVQGIFDLIEVWFVSPGLRSINRKDQL